jgi:NADPH-dependent glutamate synthase beta subunit-like oxidoreductase
MQPTKPFAITLDPATSLQNLTGSWRTMRPVYIRNLPPCNDACPAGENVQSWLALAEEGRHEAAWREIMRNNPFPAIMGRVCYHSCETACNRSKLDSAVNIHAVERFLGDEALKRGWTMPVDVSASGKRVLVVGAGPSGLSCAYHLVRLGHTVVIKEAGPRAGGMMRFGIPKYRLPRDVLDGEIGRIEQMGVKIELESPVADLATTMAQEHYDSVFLAVGAHLAKRAYIPAGDAARIIDAVSVLRGMESAQPPQLGRRVLVYGGGNTAMDVARTARRLGATEAIVVYRRTRERMPAHDFEVQEALDEGVLFRWLSTIKAASAGEFVVEKMALDENGFPQPTGEFETIEADSLVLALGQDVDLSFLTQVSGLTIEDGVVQVGPNMMTGCAGVFAGGDMVPAERTVTVAVGHGKKAARHIDAWLCGMAYDRPRKQPLATFEKLNPWYYTDAPKSIQPTLDRVRRQSTFDEIAGGLDASGASYEARRCLSCGNCFECDNCYGMCPDNAVRKLGSGRGFEFKYDYCKGCGICCSECPCGAIEMVPEDI